MARSLRLLQCIALREGLQFARQSGFMVHEVEVDAIIL